MIALIPFVIYSLFYFCNVVLLGPEKGWPDLYMLNTLLPFYITMPVIYCMTFLLSYLIRIGSNKLKDIRQRQLANTWREDLSLIEINIEVYGLGRFNGLLGDDYDLNIPYDLLEILAEKYTLDVEALTKVYVKGLMDGVHNR